MTQEKIFTPIHFRKKNHCREKARLFLNLTRMDLFSYEIHNMTRKRQAIFPTKIRKQEFDLENL